ncbi:hypothetical protein CAEBREN_22660 [Caenorhabditis brenneri]|uniref:Uncharacterized protein n=1 Tax=Caenorhabditis brenneri TaxID=135651 RepID=G0NP39_CAEBE|nr:hypothetical protein CAEBREN_22660 [Caenorhabditis brenneri]
MMDVGLGTQYFHFLLLKNLHISCPVARLKKFLFRSMFLTLIHCLNNACQSKYSPGADLSIRLSADWTGAKTKGLPIIVFFFLRKRLFYEIFINYYPDVFANIW